MDDEASRSRASLDRPCPGQWIDARYVLVRQLGAGGVGTVWEVEHTALARRFALKLLRDPRGLTPTMIARFQREARTAAAIDHPNVVRVVDYHVDGIVGPYLVMELLRGAPLSRTMQPGVATSLRETIDWLAPVASALDAIHARGLVHRDVKPENIVRVDDEQRTVKLVDFGLAVHADGRDRITRQGALVGTPHYMAPEAAEGEKATPAGDIYSLAVVAFELLTGALPHDGDTPLEVVSAKLTTPPPLLAERSGKLFAVALERALQEALDRDPAKRPRTATALIDRLEKHTQR